MSPATPNTRASRGCERTGAAANGGLTTGPGGVEIAIATYSQIMKWMDVMVPRIGKVMALWLLPLAFLFPVFVQAEQPSPPSAQNVWRMLDYLTVDYGGAVKDGAVINASEYAEMQEFAATAAKDMKGLPPSKALPALVAGAGALEAAIAAKVDPAQVNRQARALANAVLAAYPVPLAPASPPDLARGAALYAKTCTLCHGQSGHGDGPAAQGLEPPPIDFTDKTRAQKRSVFGLFQVISLGLDGTAMQSFAAMPSKERWDLAFYVSTLAYPQAQARKGAAIWKNQRKVRAAVTGLDALTQVTGQDLGQRLGQDKADAVLAYLRRNPQVLGVPADSVLATARQKLAQTLQAYQAGERQRATRLALSAYLDGFEPVEPALAIKDASLKGKVEAAMVNLRALIAKAAPVADVQAQVQAVSALLDAADAALKRSETGNGASFVAAFTILLREGLEALLIIVAMLAFLNKAGRGDAKRHIHFGWVMALLAGVLTWYAASRFVTISGASRELTEGIGAIFAALVLVFVGIWMQGKSQAAAWQKYIHEKMSRAIGRRSAWVLFVLAFVVVYREVFEVILFLIALWNQGNGMAILAGLGAAVAVLGGIAWALMNYSKRLPIGQFFLFSAILMAVLAVVLAGKGVAALQEAGWVHIDPAAWAPQIPLLGVHATWQGLIAQLAVLLILVVAFWLNDRKARAAQAAPD